MKKQIKRISIFQTSKVMAVLYSIGGLIYFVIGLIMIAASTENAIAATGFLIAPIFFLIMGFVGIAIGSLIYNLVASLIGGIEFEIEEVAE